MFVCQLFCNNQTEVPLPLGYLSHIIRIISSALNSGVQSTTTVVIQSTKLIFTLDYRGLLVLIPLYLEQIPSIFAQEKNFPNKTKSASMTILASLLSLPNHYEEYAIPLINNKKGKLQMKEVRSTIITIIKNVLTDNVHWMIEDKTLLHILNKAICCATVLIYQESAKINSDLDILKVYIQAIYNIL